MLVGGVTDIHGERFDMNRLDPKQIYDSEEVRNNMVIALNRERIEYLSKFKDLDEKIISAMKSTLRVK